MSWCPIFPEITRSSVWRAPAHIFKAWLSILTHKDHITHVWRGNAYTLADEAKITKDEAKQAIAVLSSPDEESLTPDYEGKRILSDDGEHWFVVNGQKYADMIQKEIERQNARKRTEKWRAGKRTAEDKKPADNVSENGGDMDDDRFSEFWRVYPKREAKPKAVSAWKKIKLSEVDKILKHVCDRAVSEDWTKESGKYIPLPASYLNARRWEDEKTVAPSDPDAAPPQSDWKAYEAWAMKQALR